MEQLQTVFLAILVAFLGIFEFFRDIRGKKNKKKHEKSVIYCIFTSPSLLVVKELRENVKNEEGF